MTPLPIKKEHTEPFDTISADNADTTDDDVFNLVNGLLDEDDTEYSETFDSTAGFDVFDDVEDDTADDVDKDAEPVDLKVKSKTEQYEQLVNELELEAVKEKEWNQKMIQDVINDYICGEITADEMSDVLKDVLVVALGNTQKRAVKKLRAEGYDITELDLVEDPKDRSSRDKAVQRLKAEGMDVSEFELLSMRPAEDPDDIF